MITQKIMHIILGIIYSVGDFYKGLEDEPGRPEKIVNLPDELNDKGQYNEENEYQNWGPDLTAKQQAAEKVDPWRQNNLFLHIS